jgi:hypothetical protein
MRENRSNQHGLVLIKNLRNQAILIAADVEDRAVTYSIGVRVNLPDFSEVAPYRFARRFEPLLKRRFRIPMLSLAPKLPQSFSTDDVHPQPPIRCSHYASTLSRGFLMPA